MEVLINKIYKHYMGDMYLVENIALHTETEEELVIYRGLYENCKLYARPLSNFVEKLSIDKQNKYSQVHRFELVEIPSKNKKK